MEPNLEPEKARQADNHMPIPGSAASAEHNMEIGDLKAPAPPKQNAAITDALRLLQLEQARLERFAARLADVQANLTRIGAVLKDSTLEVPENNRRALLEDFNNSTCKDLLKAIQTARGISIRTLSRMVKEVDPTCDQRDAISSIMTGSHSPKEPLVRAIRALALREGILG